jgi:hypothetical protein
MKTAISVTLTPENLLWLEAQVRTTRSRSLSALLDAILREAREASGPVTSVIGWASLPEGEAGLAKGQQEIRKAFARSLSRGRARRPRRG